MYQLCGTKRYVWIKLCAKVDGFSLIFSLMQKVNGGYWRLNCNEEVLLFYKEMWKCSIFYRKNDKTIEFKSLCPCQVSWTLWINWRKSQLFHSVFSFSRPKFFWKLHGSINALQRFEQGLNLCFSTLWGAYHNTGAPVYRRCRHKAVYGRHPLFPCHHILPPSYHVRSLLYSPNLHGRLRTKKGRHADACLPFWCRWPDSNRHAIAGGGFWVHYVYQFHHTGIAAI